MTKKFFFYYLIIVVSGILLVFFQTKKIQALMIPEESTSNKPEITFKKINPTKYLVKVRGAKGPFWLVFSENFHKKWHIYQLPDAEYHMQEEIIAEYPDLRVKEASHTTGLTPQDIKYLFRRPLDARHHLVNIYANGWYIEPEKLDLDQNFTLVIYFWPQSLYYLWLGVSALTLLGCISYLLWPKKRKTER